MTRRSPCAASTLAAAVLLLVLAHRTAAAERLSVRVFGLDDGLPSINVGCIVPGRQGFVWFCTTEGLARFDGASFRVYTTADGLPHRNVTAFLESRDGTYWVGTEGGLVHFDPTAVRAGRAGQPQRSLFRVLDRGDEPAPGQPAARRLTVYALHEDPSGGVWCGTNNGLYRVDRRSAQGRIEPAGVPIRAPSLVKALMTDRRGRLWIGANSGLYRLDADGRWHDLSGQDPLGPGAGPRNVTSILESRDGWVWVGTEFSGLRQVSPDLPPRSPGAVRSWADTKGVTTDSAARVIEAPDGALWWVGMHGLRSLRRGASPDWRDAELRRLDLSSGLPGLVYEWMTQDANGDFWLASHTRGAVRVMRTGFTGFSEADGLDSLAVHAITGARDGSVVVLTERQRGPWFHNRFDGTRFEAVRFNVPTDDWGWGWSQLSFQDSKGRWWVPTGAAVYRSAAGASFRDLATAGFFTFPSPSLPGNAVVAKASTGSRGWAAFRLFADSRGYVWAGTMDRVAGHDTSNELARWDPETDRFTLFDTGDPAFVATSFAEDRAGGVWMGGYNGGLRRAAPEGRRLEDRSSLAPAGQVGALLVDHAGRLWVGASDGGVVRIDAPEREPVVGRRYSLADGLASIDVSALVEDEAGRVYVGHARGVDVIEADGEVARNFTAADGLAPGAVLCAYRDRDGALWFGTLAGLSRFVPRSPGVPSPRTQLTITAVTVGGQPLSLSEVGEREVPSFTVPPDAPVVQIHYAVPGVTPAAVRYQFRLEGAAAGWSAPSSRQVAEFQSLAAGTYRFVVRAVSPGGAILSEAGVAPFTVLRPFWLRWWFVSLVMVATTGLLYGWHRVRLERAVAVERVRLRISRDLHDELGSNLSRLAILAEVARREPSRAPSVLSDVSDTARRLVGTLGEVVWFVDPRKDDLLSVMDLIAGHGRDLFEPQGVSWRCAVPPEAASVRLSSEARRELYLLLKEAVTNAAKHSGCSHAGLDVRLSPDGFEVEIRDDGRGLAHPEAPGAPNGNGLANMRARAAAIGATLELMHGPQGGTTVRLRV